MDQIAETFVNRDDPVPVIRTGGEEQGKQEEASSFASGMKNRLDSAYSKVKGDDEESGSPEAKDGGSLSLQDRLFAKLFERVIPSEETDADGESWPTDRDAPSRPPFSLPAMTNNFRRFNARIGIVFKFQAKVLRILNWRRPTETWSFLFIYSFLCLDPNLLLVLPLVVLLIFVMVPAFLARHPAPPTASTSSTTPYYSYEGPALAPAKTIKPVPETSRDFFHNMRDLQNSMADFAILHDTIISTLAPITNFSNQVLSSTTFLLLTALTAALFLVSHLLPWRLIFMIGGNAAVIASHPTVDSFIKFFWLPAVENGAQGEKNNGNKINNSDNTISLLGYTFDASPSNLMELLNSVAAISLDSNPEEREVEIFELQHRVWSPYSASPEWESFVFTPTPYDPLSPSRIAGDRPRGTRFFEDVGPPPGWTWKTKKWELDLDCAEWVMERMVTGVEFEAPARDGSNGGGIGEEVGGWVWDLPFQPPDMNKRDDGYDMPISDTLDGANESKAKCQKADQSANAEWEETVKQTDRIGEWRRRRWVRVVQRVRLGTNSYRAQKS